MSEPGRGVSPLPPQASPAALQPALALRVFVPFALGYFLSYVYRTVNSVLTPELVDAAALSAADLGLLTAAYFMAFALFQLPLGILLDRFSPRRVEALLLVCAAAGAGLFSVGQTLAGLAGGRALIGLGVSACMMASFKAFVQWFPGQRLPLVNGLLLACGGLGALAATVPVEAALAVTDWRMLFAGLAGLTVLVAATVWAVVPEHGDPPAHLDLASQVRGVVEVFRHPFFWRVAPLNMASQGCFLAVQGLWAGPWLRDVAGLSRAMVAAHLSLLAVAMVSGFLGFGALAERLSRRGVRPATVAGVGMAAFAFVVTLLALGVDRAVPLLWAAFGFFGTAGVLSYAVLSQSFPDHLAGRVNTALNLLVFLSAFAVQWAIGAVLGFWEDPVTRTYRPAGYQVAFGLVALLQVATLVRYARGLRRG